MGAFRLGHNIPPSTKHVPLRSITIHRSTRCTVIVDHIDKFDFKYVTYSSDTSVIRKIASPEIVIVADDIAKDLMTFTDWA
jgi:hypothetical protein